MVSRCIIQDELPEVIINLLPTVVLQQRNNLLDELGLRHFPRVVQVEEFLQRVEHDGSFAGFFHAALKPYPRLVPP